MGAGSFNTTKYSARATSRLMNDDDGMVYTKSVRSGTAKAKVHESLDVSLKSFRECRDNSDNPEAEPIAIITDVTGSMGAIAGLVLGSLHKIVSVVRDKGGIKYPAILTGAVGDAYSDKAPLQIGEFESSDELVEKHLSNVWQEGWGGGQNMESYDLPMWFFSKCVETDAWEKRGRKGYLFIIGDEAPYPQTLASQVKQHIGLDTENTPIEVTVEELLKKWELFVIRPGGTSNFRDPDVQKKWEAILPSERVVKIEDWEEINGFIASTISVLSGTDATAAIAAAKDLGLKVGDSTTTALTKLATSAITNADIGEQAKPIERL